MAFLGQQFDPNAVEPQQDFEPIPAGEYPAIITDSDMKPTKSGNGQYLELTHQITDGPLKGRLVWARLNLDNPNAKAVEIAQRSLSSICHACGVTKQINDSQQLHNIPHVIRVAYVEASGQYGASNEIKAWKRIEGQQAAQQQAPAQTTQTAAPAPAASAPPWAGKQNAA